MVKDVIRKTLRHLSRTTMRCAELCCEGRGGVEEEELHIEFRDDNMCRLSNAECISCRIVDEYCAVVVLQTASAAVGDKFKRGEDRREERDEEQRDGAENENEMQLIYSYAVCKNKKKEKEKGGQNKGLAIDTTCGERVVEIRLALAS